MSDSPASGTEKAIQQLVDQIRREPIPKRVMVLARELQDALDRQETEPNVKRAK